MESQKTTHFLLVLNLLAIAFVAFLIIKNESLQRNEDAVQMTDTSSDSGSLYDTTTSGYIYGNNFDQTNTQAEDGTTPADSGDTGTDTGVDTSQVIDLTIGQLYKTEFSADTTIPKAKYCGVRPYTGPDGNLQNLMIFVSAISACSSNLSANGTFGLSQKRFMVVPKSGVSAFTVVNNLNNQYGTTIDTIGQDNYILSVGSSNLDAYTLASLFYGTGSFQSTQPIIEFSINQNL